MRRMQATEDQLAAEQFRLDSMNGLEKLLKGRSIAGEIDAAKARLASARAVEEDLVGKLNAIQNRETPETRGLDLEDKRSINLLIVAFAQQLYLQFHSAQLASMVKESGDKSVGAINYGSKQDCDAVLASISRHRDQDDSRLNCADTLQRRSALIAEHAVYARDDEPVPIPGSVATVFAIDDNGVVRTKDANLVGEGYWGLGDVFSR